MNRKMPYDKGLLLIVLALLGFGLVTVFSASTAVSHELYGSHTRIFARQLVFIIAGFGALLITMRVDYQNFCRRHVVYGLLGLTVGLLLVVLLLPEVNGARRWVRIGAFNFQPAEPAKLVMIVFTAYYLVTRKEEFHSFIKGLLPYLGILAVMTALILVERDLGTALCIAVTAGFLLYIGGLRYRYIIGLFLLFIPAVYFLIVSEPYRLRRLMAFLDPHQDPLGTGYQIRQSLIAVGSGGLTGLGFAEGKQKLFFLPEPHTDFIFSVIGEELGFWGCVTLLLLFGLFFWRGVRISMRADTLFGTLVGLGIVGMIVIQAFINMSVAVRLLPTKGMPLPFISVGGSSMLTMMISIGVLLNISRSGHWANGK